MKILRQHFSNFLTLLKIGESGSKATFSGTEIGPAETVTTLGTLINGAGPITTPGDADRIAIRDNASGLLAYVSWLNAKAVLRTFFDTIYVAITSALITDDTVILTPTNGSTVTLNLAAARSFEINATALVTGNSFTIAVSNVPAFPKRALLDLTLLTGASVPTHTWPTGVAVPSLAASKEYWFTLGTRNNGTAWRLFSAGTF